MCQQGPLAPLTTPLDGSPSRSDGGLVLEGDFCLPVNTRSFPLVGRGSLLRGISLRLLLDQGDRRSTLYCMGHRSTLYCMGHRSILYCMGHRSILYYMDRRSILYC